MKTGFPHDIPNSSCILWFQGGLHEIHLFYTVSGMYYYKQPQWCIEKQGASYLLMIAFNFPKSLSRRYHMFLAKQLKIYLDVSVLACDIICFLNIVASGFPAKSCIFFFWLFCRVLLTLLLLFWLIVQTS